MISPLLLSSIIISKLIFLLFPLLINPLLIMNYLLQWVMVVEATDLAIIKWKDPVVDIKAGLVKYDEGGGSTKMDALFNKLFKLKHIDKTLIAGDRMVSLDHDLPKLQKKWANELKDNDDDEKIERRLALLRYRHWLLPNNEEGSKIRTVQLANGRHVSVGFSGNMAIWDEFKESIKGKTLRSRKEVNKFVARAHRKVRQAQLDAMRRENPNLQHVTDGKIKTDEGTHRRFLAADAANGGYNMWSDDGVPDIESLSGNINTNGFLSENFRRDLKAKFRGGRKRFGRGRKRIKMEEQEMIPQVTDAYLKQSRINGPRTTPTAAGWNGYIHERPNYGLVGNFVRNKILRCKDPAPRFVSHTNMEEEQLFEREHGHRDDEEIASELIQRGGVADRDEYYRHLLDAFNGGGDDSLSDGGGTRSGRHPPSTPSRSKSSSSNKKSTGAVERIKRIGKSFWKG